MAQIDSTAIVPSAETPPKERHGPGAGLIAALNLEPVPCMACGDRQKFMSVGSGNFCVPCDMGIRLREPGAYLPEPTKVWAHFLIASEADGPVGIERAARAMSTEELKQLRREIPVKARESAALLKAWELPSVPNFWVVDVLPVIQQELERRNRPVVNGNGRIARIKAALPIEDYAGRFTQLRTAGRNRLKGRCPLHQERTPSFMVYTDQQRWHCFGACGTGGDVIDLAERLGETLE